MFLDQSLVDESVLDDGSDISTPSRRSFFSILRTATAAESASLRTQQRGEETLRLMVLSVTTVSS